MGKKSEKPIEPDLKVSGAKTEGLGKCVGGVCYNPATGRLEVTLQRDSCPPEVIKEIVERTIKGVEVDIVVPKPSKKE